MGSATTDEADGSQGVSNLLPSRKLYICLYICMYMYIYIYIYTYIHINSISLSMYIYIYRERERERYIEREIYNYIYASVSADWECFAYEGWQRS